MALVQWRPANSGGGRRNKVPSGKIDDSGRLILNHAAVELLGSPAKILVSWETEQHYLVIQPAAPGNADAYTLSGGGNAQYISSVRYYSKRYPKSRGDYKVDETANGIILRKKSQEELEAELLEERKSTRSRTE